MSEQSSEIKPDLSVVPRKNNIILANLKINTLENINTSSPNTPVANPFNIDRKQSLSHISTGLNNKIDTKSTLKPLTAETPKNNLLSPDKKVRFSNFSIPSHLATEGSKTEDTPNLEKRESIIADVNQFNNSNVSSSSIPLGEKNEILENSDNKENENVELNSPILPSSILKKTNTKSTLLSISSPTNFNKSVTLHYSVEATEFYALNEPTLSIFDAQVPKNRFKILLRGKSGVGKTSFINSLCNKEVPSRHNSTLGIQVSVANWLINGKSSIEELELNLYDGDTENFNMQPDCILYFVSAIDQKSLQMLEDEEVNCKVKCVVMTKY